MAEQDKRINSLRIDRKKNVLVCGDSHIQTAVNDSISTRTINVAQSAEPYLSTFHVVQSLVNNNPHINTVVLGYSFHNLSETYDEVAFKGALRPDYYSTYLPILDRESLSLLASHNFSGIVKAIPDVFKNMIDLIFFQKEGLSSFKFLGHYYKSKLKNCNAATIDTAINRHYRKADGKQKGFSTVQETYLKKIARFCNNRNIKVVLLNAPVHKDYSNKVSDVFKTKYYALAKELKWQTTLVDFHDLELCKEYYGDGDHVNEYGAQIVTKKLDSLLFPTNSSGHLFDRLN